LSSFEFNQKSHNPTVEEIVYEIQGEGQEDIRVENIYTNRNERTNLHLNSRNNGSSLPYRPSQI
jgi:hypothetical protein